MSLSTCLKMCDKFKDQIRELDWIKFTILFLSQDKGEIFSKKLDFKNIER